MKNTKLDKLKEIRDMVLIIDKKRSIGEAAKEINAPEHVLRFWESQFPEYITPVIGKGGRRYYYDSDIKILKVIKKYLHEDGFTIKGLNNLFKNNKIDLRETTKENVLTSTNIVNNNGVEEEVLSSQTIKQLVINPSDKCSNKTAFNGLIKKSLKDLKYKMNEFYEQLKNFN